MIIHNFINNQKITLKKRISLGAIFVFVTAAGVPRPLQDFTTIPSTSWREAFPVFSTGFATPRTRSLDDAA